MVSVDVKPNVSFPVTLWKDCVLSRTYTYIHKKKVLSNVANECVSESAWMGSILLFSSSLWIFFFFFLGGGWWKYTSTLFLACQVIVNAHDLNLCWYILPLYVFTWTRHSYVSRGSADVYLIFFLTWTKHSYPPLAVGIYTSILFLTWTKHSYRTAVGSLLMYTSFYFLHEQDIVIVR